MNIALVTFAKGTIKHLLSQCSPEQQHLFKRMYAKKPSGTDLNTVHINEVVDRMDDDQLDLALTQVQNTLHRGIPLEEPKTDFIRLKWGSLKACDFGNSPELWEVLVEYNDITKGLEALDPERERELICEMIDKVNGRVLLDYTEEDCTNDREKAKRYIRNYGTDSGRKEFGKERNQI